MQAAFLFLSLPEGVSFDTVVNAMLEQEIVEKLTVSGKTLAVAESCTGGLLGARITSVSGSSACFLGGVISYSNEVKEGLLGVPGALIATHGAVSEPVAMAMAEGVRRRTGADFALSITGIAGPDGGTAAKPVGLVYIGLAGGGDTVVRRFVFGGDRSTVRKSAVEEALTVLLSVL